MKTITMHLRGVREGFLDDILPYLSIVCAFIFILSSIVMLFDAEVKGLIALPFIVGFIGLVGYRMRKACGL